MKMMMQVMIQTMQTMTGLGLWIALIGLSETVLAQSLPMVTAQSSKTQPQPRLAQATPTPQPTPQPTPPPRPRRPRFNNAFIPPGNKAPKSTQNASSRAGDRCDRQDSLVRTLMPPLNFGLTLESHPTIFLEVSKTSARSVVLAFQTEAGTDYQQAIVPLLPQNNGIATLRLPTTAAPLQIGQNYRWGIALICGATLTPSDPFFSGWVQRVNRTPQLNQFLANLSPLERLQWFNDQGYWYDALTEADSVDLGRANLSGELSF